MRREQPGAASLGPLAVPERLDDLAVAHTHQVDAPVVLGTGDPPADHRAVAVDVDVLDLELDRGVRRQTLPTGEALLIAAPHVAVRRRTGALHHAIGGYEVHEL